MAGNVNPIAGVLRAENIPLALAALRDESVDTVTVSHVSDLSLARMFLDETIPSGLQVAFADFARMWAVGFHFASTFDDFLCFFF
jgi:hypothetical protein